MRRWLASLAGRQPSPAIPTVDYYFLGAVGDLVRDRAEDVAARPISRLGPHTFASDDALVIVRYATSRELDDIRSRRWRRVYYVIDDVIPIAADCAELPAAYRSKLSAFTSEVLPKILALEPTIVAPSPAIRALFPGRHAEHLDPCALGIANGLAHFDAIPGGNHPLRLAFLGTRSHGAGIAFLCDVVERVIAAGVDTSLTLFLGSHLPKRLAGLGGLDNRPPLDWPAFRGFLARERFHVLLSPLPDTPFNTGRSITKVLDAAAIGACGIYSDRPPFAGIVTSGSDGVLAPDDPAIWAGHVAALARDPGAARRIAAGSGVLARRIGDPKRVRRFWLDRLGLGGA